MGIAQTLKEKISTLPTVPGVYIFKDSQGKIIYIGKAKSLKKRVQSYFNRPLDSKTQAMVSKVYDIEFRLTATERQAQILEASLIKDTQPQYNIDLKDDKSFPWIRISDEQFPIVSVYRKKRLDEKDTAVYFGPYTNVKLLRQALKALRRIFGFRSCRRMPGKPCLYYRLRLCPAPCAGKFSAKEYREIMRQIQMFLASEYEELRRSLADKMNALAAEKKYEDAARIRDQISALTAIVPNPQRCGAMSELEDMKEVFKLDRVPKRIEAFDISNITGKEATGSMVSFYNGIPDKNNYRRFRIKTVAHIDDYDMLREVVRRRYSRVVRERLPLPDLILIDGGKGHLLAASQQIKELGLNIPMVSIAKKRENIYSHQRNPLRLKEGSRSLNLLRRIRDEAHRFARKYHHVLRRKKIIGR